ncbi:Predicted arabinose efflux permease, MFS family [Alteribacillus persepolensis]|uniref:Predicted arabinose efflux permease, MFS family n=1 Tax=Alteribacillus persepolensis TaxID=568899 RepID=A0A1G8EB90_9BACI|nr:MFS transporter [Alteribacillus persepolensis]SDH67202.1 Predicted arabinose efflux permease, MFS family [Alteribacillus persepolensis]
MKELLKNKNFITLMLAQAISGIGDWLSIVAIITMAGLKWEASPLEVSLIFLCLALPMAFMGPVAGTAADRFDRKTLMILSDIVRAGFILVLTLADTLWIVYICLFIIGMFSAVFIPAKNGKLKEMVPDKHIKSAMSISAMIDSGTKVAGPLLSGILVAAVGSDLVFYLDGATFMLSAFIILLLPKQGYLLHENKEPSSFRTDFILGLSYMKNHAFLLTGLFFFGVSLLLIQLADSQLIILIRELTAASPDLFGYLVTLSGVGMFLAGSILSAKTNYNTFLLMLGGMMGMALSFGSMGIFTFFDMNLSIIWMPLLGFTAGFSASFVFVPFHASIQSDTPVHLTGRVFGVTNSAATSATITGPLLGGWISTVIGVIPTFVVSACLLLLLCLAGLFVKRKIRNGRSYPGTFHDKKDESSELA